MNTFKKSAGRQGFTLIELLIVIAIIGILAAVVLAALNPVKKIGQANDSKIKSDIASFATGIQIYGTKGYYPATTANLTSAGDVTWTGTGPAGVTYTYVSGPSGCTTASKDCTAVSVYSSDLFYPVNPGYIWCWRSVTGRATEAVDSAACQP